MTIWSRDVPTAKPGYEPGHAKRAAARSALRWTVLRVTRKGRAVTVTFWGPTDEAAESLTQALRRRMTRP